MAPRFDPRDRDSGRLRKAVSNSLFELALAFSTPGKNAHTLIHEARKPLKHLKTLSRLLHKVDPEAFTRFHAELADLGSALAETREAAALAETASWLAASARAPDEASRFTRLAKTLEARRDALPAADLRTVLGKAGARCRALSEMAGNLPYPQGRKKTARLLAHSWQEMMQEGRRTLSPLTVESEAEAFHDLRRCAQNLSAACALLRSLWPEAMRARQESCRDLIDNLGRESDIEGLMQLMRREPQHFGEAIDQVILERLLTRRRQALRLLSLQQAAPILTVDPEKDARRIRILWEVVGE